MDALELVRYNHFLRRRFAEFFEREVPWERLQEDHGTSHHRIADVFMHGCNMEDWWLHSVWPGKAWDGPRYDGFTSARAMRERVAQVEAKTEGMLRALGPGALQERRSLDAGDGAPRELTLEQVLAEVAVEDMHHRGEILAMLWRRDVEPPYVGYAAWASGQR